MANFVDNYSDLEELDCEACDDSLTEVFDRAADHLKSLLPNVDHHTLLSLYGYYKQGSEGSCSAPKPSWYDMKAKSKWEAWQKLTDMPRPEAKKLYIETIKKLDPTFDETSNQPKLKEQWVKVSAMQDEESVPEFSKSFPDFVKEGDLASVKDFLKGVSDSSKLNKVDDEGLAPIHWAADRGFSDVLEVLIGGGADVNLQDVDGQTALHYASSCGQTECVKTLLQHGARIDVSDKEGFSPLSVASDDSVKELFKKVSY